MALLCRKTMPKLVQRLCDAPPKRVVLSGPSGFLGSRVLDLLLQAHEHRINDGLDPGEVILLSSSPGRLMGRLSLRYPDRMKVSGLRLQIHCLISQMLANRRSAPLESTTTRSTRQQRGETTSAPWASLEMTAFLSILQQLLRR